MIILSCVGQVSCIAQVFRLFMGPTHVPTMCQQRTNVPNLSQACPEMFQTCPKHIPKTHHTSVRLLVFSWSGITIATTQVVARLIITWQTPWEPSKNIILKALKRLLKGLYSWDPQYAHIEIVVAFLVVNLFSFLLIISYGLGVSGVNFGRSFLLGPLCLPITTRAGLKSTRP